MRTTSRRVLSALALSVALGLGACGDDQPSESASSGDGEETHIHGLGVDPRDGTLFIATHHGLFAAREGERRARRFGDSRQDIMGFSVVGPGHFIGSGHPAPDQDLPANLGLIRSKDGGRSWESVSLSGEADFHALESSGERIYGFDGTQGRLMVSDDAGASWAQRSPPAAMFGLAIDPRDPDHVIAGTDRGVFASADAGETWRPLRDDLTGLLAWPTRGRLYLVEGSGRVRVSGDGGRQCQTVGSIGGQLAAFMAHEDDLYAALADSTVKQSADGGRTWTLRARQ